MNTYVITGYNWIKEIEIDDSIFEKYGDACMEAATRVIENCGDFEEDKELTAYLLVNQKNSDNIVIVSTSAILRNVGFHDAAEIFEQ